MTAAVTPELRLAAAAARRAAAQGTSLSAVLDWYVREGRRLCAAPPVRVCVQEFLWSKQASGRRRATMDWYRTALKRLARRLGHRAPAGLTEQDIADFLRPFRQPNTRVGWFHRLHAFLAWLVVKQYAAGNPAAGLARPRGDGGQGSLYTPDEARELLRRANGTDQLGFWVLSLLAGLRTTEIVRLQAFASPWSLVRLQEGLIEIPGGHGKTRRRVIRMGPALRAWLRLLRRNGQPFYPPINGAWKIRQLRRSVLAATRGPGSTGLFNLGRRSYISYRLALPGASYAAVAAAAGNSERTIRRYYRRRVTPVSARAYFRLTPALPA
jgi:integrase